MSKEFEAEEIYTLKIEDRIEHRLFGYGTVIVSEALYEVTRAVVKFDDHVTPFPIITHLARIRMVKPKEETI
tara:strand:+ start:507 stop:722 length:216 start_codon:yes stop_codon:yes gene_type:complete